GDPAYKRRLEDIATLYLGGGGAARYNAPRVFVIAAADMNRAAMEVLRALSSQRDDAAATFIANCLRGSACRGIVLHDPTFAEQLLDDAAAVSRDLFDALHAALLSCAVPRETTKELRA